ncbi:hypothetical protein BT69DRAFT_1330553 [Atractiella rhizophila]|nr:hypothetical protein BT69DRAFT_1330553 [Atractiella rhizophila]
MDVPHYPVGEGNGNLILDGVPQVSAGFDAWWRAIVLGLKRLMVYRFCLDRMPEERYTRTKPVYPGDGASEPAKRAWEVNITQWDAGNANAVAVLRANLKRHELNEIPVDMEIASEIVAKLRSLYGEAQSILSHSAWADFCDLRQSTNPSLDIAEYISLWNSRYADLLSSGSQYALSEPVRFIIFVNSLEPTWRDIALDPNKVTRDNLNECFERLKDTGHAREVRGVMEDRMLRAQSAEVYSAVMDNDGGAGAYPVVADRGYDQRFSSRPCFRPSGPFREDFRSRPPPSPVHRSYVPRSSPQMSTTPPMPRIDLVTPSRSLYDLQRGLCLSDIHVLLAGSSPTLIALKRHELNEIPVDMEIASEIVAKLRSLYGEAQSILSHSAWADFCDLRQSTNPSLDIAEYISLWNSRCSDLLSSGSQYALSEPVRFIIFVNSLESTWHDIALDPNKVTRDNLNECFKRLKDTGHAREVRGVMEDRMLRAQSAEV